MLLVSLQTLGNPNGIESPEPNKYAMLGALPGFLNPVMLKQNTEVYPFHFLKEILLFEYPHFRVCEAQYLGVFMIF